MTSRFRDVCPVSKTNSSALDCENYGENQLVITIFAQIQRDKIAKCLTNIDQVSVALAIDWFALKVYTARAKVK